MKKICISSSSLITSSNNYWSNLNDKYELIFSSYGDWSSALLNTDLDVINVLIIFSSDLDKNQEKENKAYSIFLKLLESRLSKSTAQIVVVFSSWRPNSLIRSSKFDNSSKELHYWMSKKLNILSIKYNSLYKIDLDYALSLTGLEKSFDTRNWYFAHCHLSHTGLNILSESIKKIIVRLSTPASKVLILDCDNTIWGGVVGEDGVSGIKLGQDGVGKMFVDFQVEAKKLSEEGVLIALCSKNNESDVLEVLDTHNSSVLSRKDIVSYKINWEDKSSNIVAISEELGLGMDSFVFWDDNPIERDKVRHNLPSVNTIEPPESILDWPNFLRSLDFLAKPTLTQDDKNKVNQYKKRAEFISNVSSADNEIEYLKSIDLKPIFHNINESNLSRSLQLLEKTNQFNLRTVRHTKPSLLKLLNENENNIFLMSLSDIYGDHGLIGLAAIKHISKITICIDSLLISCRVLGRLIEYAFLNEIVKRAKSYGYKFIVSQCLPTERNKPAQVFQKNNPFELVSQFNLNDKEMGEIYNYYLDTVDVYLIDLDNYQEKFKEIYK
jgi:FkbH-like protein